MADSRRASNLRMQRMEKVVEGQTRLIYFLLSILVSLLITYLIRQPDFTIPQIYVLFLLFFAIGLWITEAIPPFAVGIMIVGFLVFFLGNPSIEGTDEIDVKAFVNTWSDSVIWLLLGGFFLAEGLRKTGLDRDLFRIFLKRSSKKPKHFILAIMSSTALASMFISNTATTAMMFAMVIPFLQSEKCTPNLSKSIILGIPAAASLGGMATIIGSPPNAIAVDLINNLTDITHKIGFLEWMYFGVPIAAALILIFWQVLIRYYPLPTQEIRYQEFLEDRKEEESDLAELHLRKKLVIGILLITVILWLTDRYHPIPMSAVSGIPIIGLTMLSIITNEDVRHLPWDTLMLVAGGLSLGLAIQETGLAGQFFESIQSIHLNELIMLVLFSVSTVVLSNVMSNTATVTILIPAASILSLSNPVILPAVIGLSASCALFLPVSTPPNAIAFSTGLVNQSEFRLAGWVIGLGGPILIIAYMLLIL